MSERVNETDEAAAIAPGRLAAFSDGVIAIAATLLILEVKAPPAGEKVWPALRHEWPALAAYAVSFLVIGIAWIHHHNLFHQVRQVDRGLLLLNLGMLATLSYLPLPTATLGNHLTGDDAVPAAVFYSASVLVAAVWFTLLWNHLYARPHLLHPGGREVAREARRRSLVGPASYLLSGLLAFVSPVGSLMLNAAIIVYFIAGRRSPASRVRRAALTPAADSGDHGPAERTEGASDGAEDGEPSTAP
ncbi:TMEM175 family protein [Actinoallomurus rhizosphaericola]|uniref:TMEM175 family protein n=1 Tax=Actinoallomurus rhizosphaericola TaxID=2952536 RepID=UPI0020905E23|nr:TMEM175 family protein [Actinoallomurus rhizosphaericola]MCO5992433.1 TMEM175 family protein [Actinoallomurus rhizosphaericola]